jgi:CDP-glucose 4,6-dehydratase
MTTEFWKNKKVFITGHTGFKGSWLCLWLERLGADVTGYALDPPTEPNLFTLAAVHTGMRSMIGDVRDAGTLTAAMRDARPDIVLHLAAQTVVRYSYDHPVETYQTNVLGTVNVLEAVRGVESVRAVVNVTTDKCYVNKEWDWGYREDEALGGHDPYSNSKACSELVTAAYRSSYFPRADFDRHHVGIATARAGNVLGGGDWTRDQLIPDIMRACIEHRPVLIRNPRSTRPWQFVLEPLSGYLSTAEALYKDGAHFSEAWNFGPADDDAQPVGRIVESLTQFWGGDARWESDGLLHPHEAGSLKLDSSKARARLGWRPRFRLDTTLKYVVEWYKAYAQGKNMRELTEQHIARYETTEQQ